MRSLPAGRTLERRSRGGGAGRREKVRVNAVPTVVVINGRQRGSYGTARGGLTDVISVAFIASIVFDSVADIVGRSSGRCLGIIEIGL
jgi:hypothetical protein